MKTEKEVMQMLEDAIRDIYMAEKSGRNVDVWDKAQVVAYQRVLDIPCNEAEKIIIRIRKEVMNTDEN